MLNQSSTELFIRNFQKEDMPLLGELFQAVTKKENATFWWVGDEDNWENVYCAFENGKMVAKGQVNIINIVPTGRSKENKHSIYVNLKPLPERENDFKLLEQVYEHLFLRATRLKESLSKEYDTILCIGNDSLEAVNNQFFIKQGYKHLNSLFRMKRNLRDPIPRFTLQQGFHFSHWKMESSREETDYLTIESEVWPNTPLGLERLSQYKKNPLWTSMIIRQSGTLTSGLMAWREKDYGIIEDVFVREPWRKRGFAKFLLKEALHYLHSHDLTYTYLMVLTTNHSALSLYKSVGFYVEREETRYYIDLN